MDDHPYLRRLCDGTVKQLSPFTGTEVWTVPGRANRPLRLPQVEVRPLSSHMHTHTCAFCSGRYLETPPEYARIVRFASGSQLPGLGPLGPTPGWAPQPLGRAPMPGRATLGTHFLACSLNI